ncbi:hypothetical protein [Haloarcula nitratireducens]|uniref:Uncharacterized protein n=1 Tax=Haloarcula nitratireducens TaxID=2487749 RepID=A0AAW4P946_9EURY|nr:hypothetical protein [Halomicroarcula nitratireducens]MBX0294288.1 hypothetical protein [Halomicroarcula nitratireducens]
MSDTETETVELTESEGREVINALAEHRVAESGRDERRALNVKEFLQREFGFKDEHFDSDEHTLDDAFLDVFDTDDDHEIEFSRPEASEIVDALADHDESTSETELRSKFQQQFDQRL